MCWSTDSEILAIWCEKLDTGEPIVQLWTENNYHWYLKQTIHFMPSEKLHFLGWSLAPRTAKKLHLLTDSRVMALTYEWSVEQSKGISKNDKCVVTVIDGHKILLTAFKLGIVPPPMSHQEIELKSPVNAIAFPSDSDAMNCNDFTCLSADNALSIYRADEVSFHRNQRV